ISVSLRSGGHGVAGRAVQGDWVLDLRRFTGCRFDGSLVVAGAGVTWKQLDEFCAPRGVAVPGGTVSSTGIAGLTLGGGVGWLLPQAGLTCDRLVAVRGVTGDGRTIQVDDTSEPDTMAFLRGFGHGLFAITEFEYEPLPVPEHVSAGSLTYRLLDGAEVIEALVDAAAECPEEVSWSPALVSSRDSQVLSIDGMSFGSVDFAVWMQKVCKVRPIRSSVRLRTYPEAQRMLDNQERWGQRSAWRSVFTTSLAPEAVGFLVQSFRAAPSSGCQIFIERMGGMVKSPPRPSAFPLRWADYDVLITASWDHRTDDDVHHDWLAGTKADLCELLHQSPDAGTYANYADRAESVAVLGEYSMADLIRVRSRCDPDGRFAPCHPRVDGARRARSSRPTDI
ncbi:MAG: FAD-binding oxidoreductase, partial [Pseudonocardiaceae bacterium]